MEYIGNILYDGKLLCSDRSFVIFGSGMYGRKVLEYLTLNGMKDKLICFCDSDAGLAGNDIEGVPVCQTKDVLMNYRDADYLISGKYAKEMYQILREEGLDRIHFFTS